MFMYENEFNLRVAELVGQHLIRCGFRVLFVSPKVADTPLSERVWLANIAGADAYVSIHANALAGV